MRFLIAVTIWTVTFNVVNRTYGQGAAKKPDMPCLEGIDFFAEQVWPKVGERTCLKCHNSNGDAAESQFRLQALEGNPKTRTERLRSNRTAFRRMANALVDNRSKLLEKALGKLDHGGGEIYSSKDTGYQLLQMYVSRKKGPDDSTFTGNQVDLNKFFYGLPESSPRSLLRRVTLSLAGRLPTSSEYKLVENGGKAVIDKALDKLMNEDAFYFRLKEGFNDILLTEGYDGGAEAALSYTHFHKSRHWYKKHDPNKDRPKNDRLKYSHPKMVEYTRLIRNYQTALRREPVELIANIVKHNRPFTEIVTADYTMVSPYTAKGYGIFDQLKDKFTDPDDPFEYIPTRLKALTDDRTGRSVQESKTGFYPHAGLLSSFQYMVRYPTTETNRNRLRVRKYYEHFLGVDIMQLAPRVNDAAAITAKFETPTMQAADCVICHKVVDPVAGLYQDFYVVDGKGVFGPRKDGWYKDMFQAGREGNDLPDGEKWRSLQWLGEKTSQDRRFATAMVKHVWYLMSGQKPARSPQDIDDPEFLARRRAYLVQQFEFERIADLFTKSNFDLKSVFKAIIHSKLYRLDALQSLVADPKRLVELDQAGVVRLLTPEQLERKLKAVFGERWGRLENSDSKLNILYGGIDSREITERIREPSGAMGAIQRIMANEISCRNVASDFSKPASKRRLFPQIEPDVIPGESQESDRKIRQTIIHLHQLVLGRFDKEDSPEVKATFELFSGIVQDAKSRKGISPTESYFCQTERDKSPRDPDPHYTIRAWRGVLTYLLRQYEFLYE